MVNFITAITLFFSLFNFSPVYASTYDEQVSLDFEQKTFSESLEGLSQLFDLQIELYSSNRKLPQERFSFHLEKVTFEESIKEIFRKAKISNHALVYNQDSKTARLWVLSSPIRVSISSKNRKNIFFENFESMTFDQMILLAQNSQGQEETIDKPLTLEQMNQLQEQGFEIEEETDEFTESLTKEQFDQLQEQSLLTEGLTEENQEPLSSEEMEQLLKDAGEAKIEDEGNMVPLSREQMFLLKEQVD